jgi:hypothetical protein
VLGKKTEAGIDRTLELSAFLLDQLRGHLAAVPAPEGSPWCSPADLPDLDRWAT